MRMLKLALVVGSLCVAVTFSASASPISTGVVYGLANTGTNGIAPPPWGLRLDGILGDTTRDADWTFDFDRLESAMFMRWDEANMTLELWGHVYGGRDIGAGYDPETTAVWDVAFTYTDVVDEGNMLTVYGRDGPAGQGSMTNRTSNEKLPLSRVDFTDLGRDVAFKLIGDQNGATGHGLLDVLGEGEEEGEYIDYRGWDFRIGRATSASNVPEPSVGLLLGASLLFAGALGRRTGS